MFLVQFLLNNNWMLGSPDSGSGREDAFHFGSAENMGWHLFQFVHWRVRMDRTRLIPLWSAGVIIFGLDLFKFSSNITTCTKKKYEKKKLISKIFAMVKSINMSSDFFIHNIRLWKFSNKLLDHQIFYNNYLILISFVLRVYLIYYIGCIALWYITLRCIILIIM